MIARAACMAVTIWLAGVAAHAEAVVAGLSQDAIAITTNFEGSEILIFGAVRREAPPPGTAPLEVIITVQGPPRPVTVRRKDRRFGIWVNTDASEIDAAPTFYAVQTTAPLSVVLSQTEDMRHRVTLDRVIRAVGTGRADQDLFNAALIRIRSADGAYQLIEGGVRLREQTLFDTAVRLPANLTEGEYVTRIFLMRDGAVVDLYEQTIPVRKVGVERMIYTLAQDRPLIYGLLSLCIAIAAGWMASAVFRAIRR
jgi:uncharacterized protein (TIGR02186 family)